MKNIVFFYLDVQVCAHLILPFMFITAWQNTHNNCLTLKFLFYWHHKYPLSLCQLLLKQNSIYTYIFIKSKGNRNKHQPGFQTSTNKNSLYLEAFVKAVITCSIITPKCIHSEKYSSIITYLKKINLVFSKWIQGYLNTLVCFPCLDI